MRSASTRGTNETRIWQKLSFAVWSNVAAAFVGPVYQQLSSPRMPAQADIQRPVPQFVYAATM